MTDALFLRVSAFEAYRNGYVNRISYGCANPQPPAGSTATVDSRGFTVNPLAPDYLQGNAPSSLGGNCNIGNEGGIDVRGVDGNVAVPGAVVTDQQGHPPAQLLLHRHVGLPVVRPNLEALRKPGGVVVRDDRRSERAIGRGPALPVCA